MKFIKYAFALALVAVALMVPFAEYYPGLDDSVYKGFKIGLLIFAYLIVAITPVIRTMDMFSNKSLFEYNHIVVISTLLFLAMGQYVKAILCMAIYGIFYDLLGES